MLVLLLLLTYIKRSTSSGLCPTCDSCLLPPAISLIKVLIGPPAAVPAIICVLGLLPAIAPIIIDLLMI